MICLQHQVHVFASSSDWFIGLRTAAVAGQSDYFHFRFVTLLLKIALTGFNLVLILAYIIYSFIFLMKSPC